MPKKAEVIMSKPKPRELAVISKGAAAPSERIHLSLYASQAELDRIEAARKANPHLVPDRNQWLRMAVFEKLAKDGF